MTAKTDKLFSGFGVSFFQNKHRLRFSTDTAGRIKTLVNMGDTDINIVDLPSEMTKLQAVQWAAESGHFETEHEKSLIVAFIEKNSKSESAEPKKRGRPRKVVDAAPVLSTVEEAADEAAEVELDEVIGSNDELSDEELLAQLEENEAEVA